MSCDFEFGAGRHGMIVIPRWAARDHDCFDKAEMVCIDGNVFVRSDDTSAICVNEFGKGGRYEGQDGGFFCSRCACTVLERDFLHVGDLKCCPDCGRSIIN